MRHTAAHCVLLICSLIRLRVGDTSPAPTERYRPLGTGDPSPTRNFAAAATGKNNRGTLVGLTADNCTVCSEALCPDACSAAMRLTLAPLLNRISLQKLISPSSVTQPKPSKINILCIKASQHTRHRFIYNDTVLL